MAIGPVEYLIIEFPGEHFRTEIVPPLAKLIESGTIRIVDLVFILKAQDGTVTTYEFDELEELAPFGSLQGEAGGLLNQEDIDFAAVALHNGTSAVVVVWEDTWATELATAVRDAGGLVVEGLRIPAEMVDEALAQPAG